MEILVQEILKKHWKDLRKKANVVGYSGSMQPRIKDGKVVEGTRVFRVYVLEKVSAEKLRMKDLVPRILIAKGQVIETDIVVHKEMKALTCKDTPRPVRAGCSGMAYYPKATACTVGWFAKNKKTGEEEFIGILANNHCCTDENMLPKSAPYTVPSKYDGGTIAHQVAELWRFVEIKFEGFTCPFRETAHKLYRFFKRETPTNRVDIGLVRLTISLDQVNFVIEQIGPVKGKRRGAIGETAEKTGRTTGFTSGAVLIDNDWYGYVTYSRGRAFFGPCGLLRGSGFSAGGDSSSCIVWVSDKFMPGFLFAGSDTHTIFCHQDLVEEDLEVEILVP